MEAPGTPLHTEKEKHLDRATMKNITHGKKKMLFASEIPLRNQAIFYDLSGGKKSKDFLECMKQLIHTQGHQTLSDAFGFLEKESERAKLEILKETQGDSLSEETARSKRIDSLNSRLLRKEARELQLRNELQIMLDQRTKEETHADIPKHISEESQAPQNSKRKKGKDDILQRQLQPDGGTAEPSSESESEQPEDEKNGAIFSEIIY